MTRVTTEPTTPPPRRLEYVRLDEVKLAEENPKGHDPGIRRSIEHHGFGEVPLRDDRTGRLVAGHGRHEKLTEMMRAGQAPPDGVLIDPRDGMWMMPVISGWRSRSDADAKAYLAGSNILTMVGGWDHDGFMDILHDVNAAGLLALTGVTDEAYRKMLDGEGNPFDWQPGDRSGYGGGTGPGQELDDEGEGPSDSELGKGDLLALAGVTVGEPKYAPQRGEVWELGEHLLVVADVHKGWETWGPLMAPGKLFWPYPTPLAPFAEHARRHPVVMVQPNGYLAGWTITKWERITRRTAKLRAAS